MSARNRLPPLPLPPESGRAYTGLPGLGFEPATSEHSSQGREVRAVQACGTVLWDLFLTPQPLAHLGRPQGRPRLLVFAQNKAASRRCAKAKASVRAGERELYLCLLLLKEGVQGTDLPLNREGVRPGWGVGGEGGGYMLKDRAGADTPETRFLANPLEHQEPGGHFSIQHAWTHTQAHALTHTHTFMHSHVSLPSSPPPSEVPSKPGSRGGGGRRKGKRNRKISGQKIRLRGAGSATFLHKRGSSLPGPSITPLIRWGPCS